MGTISRRYAAALAERDEWKGLAQELRVAHSRISGTLCDTPGIIVDPLPDGVAELSRRYVEALAERDELRQLLAVMNGDGGHYAEEHGTKAAVEKAIRRYDDMSRELDRLQHADADAHRTHQADAVEALAAAERARVAAETERDNACGDQLLAEACASAVATHAVGYCDCATADGCHAAIRKALEMAGIKPLEQ